MPLLNLTLHKLRFILSSEGIINELQMNPEVVDHHRVYFLTLFLLLPFYVNFRQATEPVRPEAIIERMKEIYSECRSYQDEGSVITKSEKSGSQSLNPVTFKTYFVRPDKFRFEWKTRLFPGGLMLFNVIWSDGEATHTYWESGKLDKMDSLQSGIMANAGVTRG